MTGEGVINFFTKNQSFLDFRYTYKFLTKNSVKSSTLYFPKVNKFNAASHPKQEVKTVFAPVVLILLCLLKNNSYNLKINLIIIIYIISIFMDYKF